MCEKKVPFSVFVLVEKIMTIDSNSNIKRFGVLSIAQFFYKTYGRFFFHQSVARQRKIPSRVSNR